MYVNFCAYECILSNVLAKYYIYVYSQNKPNRKEGLDMTQKTMAIEERAQELFSEMQQCLSGVLVVSRGDEVKCIYLGPLDDLVSMNMIKWWLAEGYSVTFEPDQRTGSE